MVKRHEQGPSGEASYRANEMRVLAGWIASGASGSVVGLVGSGRSNLLKFLCEHPTALNAYQPELARSVALVAVDLYDLPSINLADLYRTILHAFYWIREDLPPPLGAIVTTLFSEHRAISDAFLTQTALYELLLAFQREQVRVVLVMNRFDRFCERSTLHMVNTLRGLRDRFKETLSYIVGMRQAVAYLPDPTVLGDMYELFDNHICYVGALNSADSRKMVTRLARAGLATPETHEVAAMLQLSGGYPSILRAIVDWWYSGVERPGPPHEWATILLDEATIRYRIDRLWQGLTEEERQALVDLSRRQQHNTSRSRSAATNGEDIAVQRTTTVLRRLVAKGCCRDNDGQWRINGDLLAMLVARYSGDVRGRIWFDENTQTIMQGQNPIEGLTPLEYAILRFLTVHPGTRHSSNTIIEHGWSNVDIREAITTNNLQVHVSNIRRKIEPQPTEPRYLITWHGRPGGYQFFPEGKPNAK
ncbi:winged helix-turn-helix transcriptional regulator [Candidatus Gracilibacteria bacterium]|nr:winged helix-turn-helix transcriptional regulator [Candidatus Gracilibacteria bacterium]